MLMADEIGVSWVSSLSGHLAAGTGQRRPLKRSASPQVADATLEYI